jgi:hypothetical protein
MPERIITDSRGQRWDVREDGKSLVFRHQSGNELRALTDRPLDQLSTDEVLAALDDARRAQGLPAVGHGQLDVAFDPEGYETGR